ncbi:MAG TPA: hypothetical protein VE912_06180 [Bacteroidales bacterium]|nr:hypothetical protein [Bacteroidales bacterium]
MQAEVSAGVSVLANVLFCALAVHILSFFNAAKLPLSFLRLVGNVPAYGLWLDFWKSIFILNVS